jgi:hypothetical protein
MTDDPKNSGEPPDPSEPTQNPEAAEDGPLLALRGSGKHLWADEHADEYVRRLREGW